MMFSAHIVWLYVHPSIQPLFWQMILQQTHILVAYCDVTLARKDPSTILQFAMAVESE